ncbi:hypothetical protein [Lentzea sp. NPDC003310]|uniref:hypothetical protein n=1 Tax=Lentzea sp. NPDC003310 TaxID=3154447 RepID=UPI0033A27D7B
MTRPEPEYEDVSRGSLAEDDENREDTTPGRSDSGSAHPEAPPTGNVGIADYSAGDDPDRG